MAISNEQVVGAVKRNPIVTICIVISLVLAAALYFRSDLGDQAAAELEQKTREGQRMANNIKNAAQLDEQLAALQNDNREIADRLVHAGSLAENLQYFYKLESDTGTKLIDLRQTGITGAGKSAKAGPKPAFDPVGYNVGVQGTYAQLVDFLRRLENGRHFCRILTAGFTPAAAGTEGAAGATTRSDTLTLTLTLEFLGTP
jgi:hypothetical protein